MRAAILDYNVGLPKKLALKKKNLHFTDHFY